MKTVGLYTLGCKVSQYETEAIAEEFVRQGFTVCDFDSVCQVYVINTCTVTAESDRKCRQIIRRAARKNPDGIILVCGCYSQRSPEKVAELEGVSAVIGSGNKLGLVAVAKRLLSGLPAFEEDSALPEAGCQADGGSEKEGETSSPKVIFSHGGRARVTDIYSEPFEDMKITSAPRTRVYVKIEDGCECRCSYCAIPSARGRVRSKPREAVLEEVSDLARSGVREIVLTGIETGSYGADFGTGYGLAELLCELDSTGLVPRIRLGSLAPELVGEKFCEKVKGLASLAPHFHISLQSGSDNVLRRMRRRYTRAMALENIRRLKAAIPNAQFTTDLMVGFPGESEADFLETVSLVREIGFLDCHVFAYSRRRGTQADLFADQISEDVKRRRSEELISVCRSVRDSVLDRAVESGEALSCILETERDGVWSGHSDSFIEVCVPCDSGAELHGEIRRVLPVSHKNGVIIGKIID